MIRTDEMPNYYKGETTRVVEKIKPQELRFSVATDFARVAATAVWNHLLTHYDLRAATQLEGFPSDEEQTLIIRLFCQDKVLRSIRVDIAAHFEFSIN